MFSAERLIKAHKFNQAIGQGSDVSLSGPCDRTTESGMRLSGPCDITDGHASSDEEATQGKKSVSKKEKKKSV